MQGDMSDVAIPNDDNERQSEEKSPNDSGYSGSDNGTSNGDVSPPAPGTFRCAVCDPEKKGEGMHQYIAYRIHTMGTDEQGTVSQSSVIRRFNDFHWLHSELSGAYKGVLIPPLPDKIYMRRFTQDFIDERRRWLEMFLNRLAKHSLLCHSPDVILFLHGDDNDLTAAKEGKTAAYVSANTPEATQAPVKPAAQKGFMSYIKEGMQSLSHTFGGAKERERTQEDEECDEVTAYASSLETSLHEVHENVQSLVSKNKDLAKNWFQLGLACTLLGQYENDQNERKLGDTFSKVGHTADRLSVLVTEKVDKENLEFREPIKDYIRMVNSVKAMMKTRADALVTHQIAVSSLEGRQAKLASLQDVGGKEEQALQAEKRVLEAQTNVDSTKMELDRVTSLCISEATRFRERKQSDLKRVVESFVEVQIKHSQKVQAAWESILPSVQNL